VTDTFSRCVFVLGTGRVIQGWDQGVFGMKVGGAMPPNSALVFDLELLDVR
jgi:FKBP-type peptidyl-prolyl cis-trans isomerase FkpA